MKRIVFVILLSGLFLSITNAQKVYTIDDVPNVHLQDINAYVSDPTHKLSVGEIQKLNAQLHFFEDSLGVQCATIVLPAIDKTASVFAHDLFNKWGIGNKETNRGLLILLVYGGGEGNRDIYMATGYGLEGDLPDALCKHIQTKIMVPLLKDERFGEGLLAGVQETRRLLENEEQRNELVQQIENQEDEYPILTTIAGIMLVIVVILGYIRIDTMINAGDPYLAYIEDAVDEPSITMKWILFLIVPLGIPYLIITWFFRYIYIFSRLNCMKCGSRNVQKPISKQIKLATKDHNGILEHSFLCKDCGHIEKIKTQYMAVERSLKNSVSRGSRSGGGSSSGGSWGGGSSGGGGAGTSF